MILESPKSQIKAWPELDTRTLSYDSYLIFSINGTKSIEMIGDLPREDPHELRPSGA